MDGVVHLQPPPLRERIINVPKERKRHKHIHTYPADVAKEAVLLQVSRPPPPPTSLAPSFLLPLFSFGSSFMPSRPRPQSSIAHSPPPAPHLAQYVADTRLDETVRETLHSLCSEEAPRGMVRLNWAPWQCHSSALWAPQA